MKNKIYTGDIQYELDENNESITRCPHRKKCGRKIMKVASSDCQQCEDHVDSLTEDNSAYHIVCSEVPHSPSMITNIPGCH